MIHCSQGVSRSATLGIAYLMWKLDQGYDEVFQAVKAIRGVANPNIGFTCQVWVALCLSPVSSFMPVALLSSAAIVWLFLSACRGSGLPMQ